MTDTSLSMHFTFDSHILFDPEIDRGYMKYYVPFPDKIAALFEQADVTHVEGTLNGQSFRRAIQRGHDGSRRLMFGKIWLEQATLEVNMPVMVNVVPDPDPSRIELPDELAAELHNNPDLERIWESLSVSKRKTLAYGIARAKRPETRQKRSQDLLEELSRTYR
jgi:hypothetical protein